MKKDDLQTINQIHLLSQKNASNSDNTMAKWKGLDKIKVFMWSNPFCKDGKGPPRQ